MLFYVLNMLEWRLEQDWELIKGKIGHRKFLQEMEMEEREKDEAVAARAKENSKRVTGTRGTGRTASASETAQKTRSALLRFLLDSENSLTKSKDSILAQSLVKPPKAQAMSPLPAVQLLELPAFYPQGTVLWVCYR